MRMFWGVLLGSMLAAPLAAQPYGTGACINGQCPIGTSDVGGPVQPPPVDVDARAVVRIVNVFGARARSRQRHAGGCRREHGLIITCAHLFRDGTGTLTVTFPDERSYAARLAKIDQASDLAALVIARPNAAAWWRSPPIIRAAAIGSCRADMVATAACGAITGRHWGYVSTTGSLAPKRWS